MQKGNIKKILGLALAFIITLCICLTYVSTDGFNVVSFAKSSSLLFSKCEEKSFDREYITNNQNIVIAEPNGVGAIAHKYSLPLEELPKEIVSVAVEFDDEKSSVGNIVLRVVTDGVEKIFSISNTAISNYTKIIQVGNSSVDDVEIISQYDSFGGSSTTNEEFVNISSVKINDGNDIKALKRTLLVDFIKSIVISIVIILALLLILKSDIDNKIFKKDLCIEKKFLLIAIIAGLAFSFLMPVYQVPDEQTHINAIYRELNWDIDIYGQAELVDLTDTLRVIRNYDEKVNPDTYFNMKTKAPLPSSFVLPTLHTIRHLPQVIGLVFTSLMRLPWFICLLTAEICALLVYAIFGYFAIKIMPFKKELMMAIMLLPICLQEVPSISYDSFLMATYFLLFAYIMYVKFTKEKFTLLDVLIILALTFVVAITKIPYALVVGLVLLIPISKIDFNFGIFRLTGDFIKKYKIVFLVLAAIVVACAGVMVVKVIPYIPEGKTFLAAVYAPRMTSKLIFETIKAYGGQWLVQMTGSFGWFDTPVALVFTVFVVANLLLFNLFDYNNKLKQPADKNPFKVVEILYVMAIAAVMFVITILSMVGWTLTAYGIDPKELSVATTADSMANILAIGGLQGRYFVPAIPLFLVPYYFPKLSKYVGKINDKTYLYTYYAIMVVYLVIVLLNRYWI